MIADSGLGTQVSIIVTMMICTPNLLPFPTRSVISAESLDDFKKQPGHTQMVLPSPGDQLSENKALSPSNWTAGPREPWHASRPRALGGWNTSIQVGTLCSCCHRKCSLALKSWETLTVLATMKCAISDGNGLLVDGVTALKPLRRCRRTAVDAR